MTQRHGLDVLLASHDIVFGDGAMGTMLLAAGFGATAPLEAANLEAPDFVRAVHRAYLAAGSQILQTNTFGANRLRLAETAWADRLAELNRAGVRLARSAAEGLALVAGTMGPVGGMAPLGSIAQADAAAAFREQAELLAEAGVDFLIIETVPDPRELRLALRAVKEACDLPIICSMTHGGHQSVFAALDPARTAQDLLAGGAAMVGINCGPGPTTAYTALHAIHAAVPAAPLLAQPSAGIPERRSSRPTHHITPERFAAWGLKVHKLGVKMLGGCCGTTPDHIRAAVEAFRHQEAAARL